MPSQIEYYDRFGKEFKEQIIACPEPHLWTTDYAEKGRVYREIKERIEQQEKLVAHYFTNDKAVLDVGCGFGRQAYAMAQKGFVVTGTDTSKVFIQIAKELFAKHNLQGRFICTDITNDDSIERCNQLLLLDVLEHIPPGNRKKFMQRMAALTWQHGKLIISIPHVKRRLTSQINNGFRKQVTQHLSFFRNLEEHPYPIPLYKEIRNLTETYFTLIDQVTTPLTDYYVFERQ